MTDRIDTGQSAPLDCDTVVVRSAGRLIVMCEVQGFAASGLSVAELFRKVRPQLESAVIDAAARDPDQPRRRRPVVVQLDDADSDQSISLLVYDPAACAGDMDGHLTRMQTILEQALADQRTGGGL